MLAAYAMSLTSCCTRASPDPTSSSLGSSSRNTARGNARDRSRASATATRIDSGWTTPGRSGHASNSLACSPSCRRFVTTPPRMGSAGCEAYQPTTLVVRLFWLRMFQSAFVLRVELDETCSPDPSGLGSTKFSTPCLSAVLPVVIEVQSSGESFGSSVPRSARAPDSTRRRRLGILPAANSRLIRIQSAASQPMTSRRLAGRANMDPMLTDKKSSVGDLSRSPTRCFRFISGHAQPRPESSDCRANQRRRRPARPARPRSAIAPGAGMMPAPTAIEVPASLSHA